MTNAFFMVVSPEGDPRSGKCNSREEAHAAAKRLASMGAGDLYIAEVGWKLASVPTIVSLPRGPGVAFGGSEEISHV